MTLKFKLIKIGSIHALDITGNNIFYTIPLSKKDLINLRKAVEGAPDHG